MIERVHEHLTGELKQNARTDTVFVLAAILLNLVLLGINSSVAGEDAYYSDRMLQNYSTRYTVFISIVVVIGVVSVAATLITRFL
jgi:O-antigen/teichoic acid export membrane protein